jgi:hypothetical protein
MKKGIGAIIILLVGCGLQFILLSIFGYDPGIELGIIFIVGIDIIIGVFFSLLYFFLPLKTFSMLTFWIILSILVIVNLWSFFSMQRN